MDEEIAIIDSNTRTEKIRNFFKNHLKKIVVFFIGLISILVSLFVINEFKDKTKIKISNLYNSTIIDYSQNTKNKTKENLLNIIEEKDPTYSPLSLYFIIDMSSSIIISYYEVRTEVCLHFCNILIHF